jgi:hypothetical protein
MLSKNYCTEKIRASVGCYMTLGIIVLVSIIHIIWNFLAVSVIAAVDGMDGKVDAGGLRLYLWISILTSCLSIYVFHVHCSKCNGGWGALKVVCFNVVSKFILKEILLNKKK